jgi:hypothetical protein
LDEIIAIGWPVGDPPRLNFERLRDGRADGQLGNGGRAWSRPARYSDQAAAMSARPISTTQMVWRSGKWFPLTAGLSARADLATAFSASTSWLFKTGSGQRSAKTEGSRASSAAIFSVSGRSSSGKVSRDLSSDLATQSLAAASRMPRKRAISVNPNPTPYRRTNASRSRSGNWSIAAQYLAVSPWPF